MMDILIGGTVDRAVPQHAEAKDHADLGIKSWSVSLARAANDYARSPPAPAAPRARVAVSVSRLARACAARKCMMQRCRVF